MNKIEEQNPKQYLVMLDEVNMAMLGRMVPGMRFLEVEGMTMEGNDKCMVLVSPTRKTEVVVNG